MKKNDFLSEPTRQSNAAIILILLRLVLRLIRQLWPFFLLLLIGKSGRNPDSYFYIFLGLGAVSAVGSIIAFFRYYYYVKDGEFVIEKGIFNRIKQNVPFDRIQTVNFSTGPIHRFFDVVTVEIDTAGSKGKEFEITAVKREQAEAIRNFLIREKQEALGTAKEELATDTPSIATPSEEVLLQLSPKDLLRVGVSQNHLRTAGLILGLSFGLWENLREALNMDYEDLFNGMLGLSVKSNFLGYSLLILAFLLVSFLITLLLTVYRFFDLRLVRTGTGFKVVSGLLDRKEQSATLQKVQLLQWSTNPIRRAFKMFTLQIKQASSVSVGARRSIRVPGCYAQQLSTVRAAYFPEEATEQFKIHTISPLFVFRRTLYLGGIPAIAIMAQLYFSLDGSWWFLLGLLWIPLVYLLAQRAWRKWKIFVSPEGLRTEKGMIGESDTLLLWRKLQGVEFSQSIYQRRKSLTNIILHTAAGDVEIPYVDLHLAQQIRDYVLYKVESDKGAWM